MDVVRVQVGHLGGTLNLDSVAGKGLTVELRVPLPLSRSHALLAHVARYRVAIASKGLSQILYEGDGEIKQLGNEQVLVLGDEIYPVFRLDDLLHVSDPRKTSQQRSHGAILLVNNEDKMTAVLVDAITDNRDVVIKSLGHYIPKIQGFIGATILGDGAVVPVLDIPELLRTPGYGSTSSYQGIGDEAFEEARDLPIILVVDDSLSNRRALEQLLTDGGYKVRTARDGIEAVEMIAQIKPRLVLTDLEMPRMNGIELTAHIRTQSSTKHLPVIMITSRSTQKHRQLAEEAGINFYITKPVREDDLFSKVQMLMDNPMLEAMA
jgi:chemosensory pili system protein ChpA (sensor histidine kinase/response regulator)